MPRSDSPSSSEIVACEMLLLLSRCSDSAPLLCPSAATPEGSGSPARRARDIKAESGPVALSWVSDWQARDLPPAATQNAAWARDSEGIRAPATKSQKSGRQHGHAANEAKERAQPHSAEKQSRHQDDGPQPMHISKHARVSAPEEDNPSVLRDGHSPAASNRGRSSSQASVGRAAEGTTKAGAPSFYNPLGDQAEHLAYLRRQYDAELGSEAAAAAVAAAAAMRGSAYNYAARMRSASQDMYLSSIPAAGQYDHMGYPQYPAGGFDYSQYGDRYSSNFYNYPTASSASGSSGGGYPLAAPVSASYFGGASESSYPGRNRMAGYPPEYSAATSYPGWV